MGTIKQASKLLNSTEDAHTKSLSIFEMDEFLRECRAVYDLPTRSTFLIVDDPFTEGPRGIRSNASRHWIIKSRKIRHYRIVHGTFQDCHDIQRHHQMSCDPGAKDFAVETLRVGLELVPFPGPKQLECPLPKSRRRGGDPTTILLYAFNRPRSGVKLNRPLGYNSVFDPPRT